jgi:hypothetical protein
LNSRDRYVNAALLVAAIVAWIGVAVVLLTLDPRGDPAVLLLGATLLGTAVAVSLAPLLWLGGFALNRGIAYRGDWFRASRRGFLVGLVVAVFVVLRGQGELNVPLALFILAMAVLAEITLSLRR